MKDQKHFMKDHILIFYMINNKILFLWTGNPDDVYWYAQTLYLTGQYHRASQLLKSKKLDKVRPVKNAEGFCQIKLGT